MHFRRLPLSVNRSKTADYYENNFVQTLHLLDALIENNVKKLFLFDLRNIRRAAVCSIDEKPSAASDKSFRLVEI